MMLFARPSLLLRQPQLAVELLNLDNALAEASFRVSKLSERFLVYCLQVLDLRLEDLDIGREACDCDSRGFSAGLSC